MSLDIERDMQDLKRAVKILEFPTFTAQAAKHIGRPIEKALKVLPAPVLYKIGDYTESYLNAALKVVLLTVDKKKRFQKSNNILHKSLVVATGATGGFFGGLTMAAELPISMGIIMRSIVDVAREEGEDLADAESRLACISVLGMDTSSQTKDDPYINTSKYFIVRSAMAGEIAKATEYLISNAVTEETAPIVIKFLSRIAERFSIQLTEKMAADLVPVVGAVSAAGINYLFIDHFQRIARGHFIVRRLERQYGTERAMIEYEAILASLNNQPQKSLYYTETAATNEE